MTNPCWSLATNFENHKIISVTDMGIMPYFDFLQGAISLSDSDIGLAINVSDMRHGHLSNSTGDVCFSNCVLDEKKRKSM